MHFISIAEAQLRKMGFYIAHSMIAEHIVSLYAL